MLNLKSLRGQSVTASAVSIFIFIAVSGTGLWGLFSLSSTVNNIDERIARNHDHTAPLAEYSERILLDVVQVQQWLTDISATRGRDGLNDGMDKAEKFAKAFKTDTEEALRHAEKLGLPEVIATLKATQEAFPAYYNVGKKMAQTYIDFGPEGGNKMMDSFDAAAGKINKNVAVMNTSISAFSDNDSNIIKQSARKASKSAHFQLKLVLALFVIGVCLLGFIAVMTDRIVKIISKVSAILRTACTGELDVRLTHIKGHGEHAEIQHNFNHLMDVSEAFVREIRAAMHYVSNGKYYRNIREEGMKGSFLISVQRVNSAVEQMSEKVGSFSSIADKFEIDMKAVVQTVTSAATELQATAQSMASTATITSDKAGVVATAATEASSNVQTVASAAEELSSSISEISRQVSQSSEIASQAVTDAEQSRQNVQGLADSASKIGEVINLISDIADQTNLLALNATIEAARAGDAGKGFAVVASEVKNLANQTAKATEEISQQVGGVQHATEDAVTAIQSIGETIGRIDEASTAIASAVEEQGAATQEIARNVEQAASGTNEVTSNITEVTQGASETGHAASEVLAAADELAKQGDVLGREMDSFLVELRRVI